MSTEINSFVDDACGANSSEHIVLLNLLKLRVSYFANMYRNVRIQLTSYRNIISFFASVYVRKNWWTSDHRKKNTVRIFHHSPVVHVCTIHLLSNRRTSKQESTHTETKIKNDKNCNFCMFTIGYINNCVDSTIALNQQLFWFNNGWRKKKRKTSWITAKRNNP